MSTSVIVIAPENVLETPAAPEHASEDSLGELTARMRHIMHRHDGIGLAAPQIGVSRRIAVLELTGDEEEKEKGQNFPFTVLIDPEIIWSSKEKETKEEGCLSLPGVAVDVERSTSVRIKTTTLEGKRATLQAEGLFARALQHEIDHLNGILITRRAVIEHPLSRPPRIVFFGSGDFALPILEMLRHNGYPLKAIVTESAPPHGRALKVKGTSVHAFAKANNVPLLTPKTLKDEGFQNEMRALEADIGIVASYGKIIPREVFEIPTFKTLNIHPSYLPRHRGATPIQSAILVGDRATGVTIIVVNQHVDTGPILARIKVPISHQETGYTLNQKLAAIGAQLLHATLASYIAGKIKPRPQPKEGATLTHKLSKKDGEIDFTKPPQEIVCQIRALQPWPGAYTHLGGQLLKIWKAHVEDGMLAFDVVQLEGKRTLGFSEFLRGWRGALDFHPVVRVKSARERE